MRDVSSLVNSNESEGNIFLDLGWGILEVRKFVGGEEFDDGDLGNLGENSDDNAPEKISSFNVLGIEYGFLIIIISKGNIGGWQK